MDRAVAALQFEIALAVCLCREWEEVGKDKANVASNDFLERGFVKVTRLLGSS